MLTETHHGAAIMTMGLDEAESIVKNTALEAHAHGDTRPAIDNDDGFG